MFQKFVLLINCKRKKIKLSFSKHFQKYRKNPKYSDTQKIAEIILNFE